MRDCSCSLPLPSPEPQPSPRTGSGETKTSAFFSLIVALLALFGRGREETSELDLCPLVALVDCTTAVTVCATWRSSTFTPSASRIRAPKGPQSATCHFMSNRAILGCLGPSGAGKSTTQNVLIRLLDGYEGNVAVLGKDLRAWDRGYYRRIGVSFEAPNHYLKLTARENLQLFAGLHGGDTVDPDALQERVGLQQDAGKLVAEFSKGMRGRLTFARALLHRPELLFLDEPTAGLDPVTARRIRQVIRDARHGGATVFLTTHDMVTANELCDRVAFLVDGQIAAPDSPPPRSLRLAHGRKVVRMEAVADGTRIEYEFPVGGVADNADFLRLLRSGAAETILLAGAQSRSCGGGTVSARSCTTRGPREADERRRISRAHLCRFASAVA